MRAAALLGRVMAGALGLLLLYVAGHVLANIWTYNDSGTLAYILYALVPGLPGVMLLIAASGVGQRRDG